MITVGIGSQRWGFVKIPLKLQVVRRSFFFFCELYALFWGILLYVDLGFLFSGILKHVDQLNFLS